MLSYAPPANIAQAEGQSIMRQLAAAVAVATTGLLLAACGDSNGGSASSSSSATTTTTSSKAPLAQAALAGLLVSPADVDTALGITGSKSLDSGDQLKTDNPSDIFAKSYKFPDDCLFIMGPAESLVYANSGNSAVHRERDGASGDPGSPDINQAVVLFPAAQQANAFFTASAQHWSGCANRKDDVPGEGDNPDVHWEVGAVSNTNGVLTTTTKLTLSKNGQTLSGNCQRVLTTRNNVAIDVEACKQDDPGNAAVTVANQIAGKVDKQ
jgi:PknH-like extracellular domain